MVLLPGCKLRLPGGVKRRKRAGHWLQPAALQKRRIKGRFLFFGFFRLALQRNEGFALNRMTLFGALLGRL
jgi:hypothetical protein